MVRIMKFNELNPSQKAKGKMCFSYSGGKDSMLALHELIEIGYQPVCLVTSINLDVERSWFHGISEPLLEAVAESLGIPLLKIRSDARSYQTEFIKGLEEAKALGAEYCGFGDIDGAENRKWDEDTTTEAGLIPLLPLWQRDHEKCVADFLNKGYSAVIKTISKSYSIPQELLGKTLNTEIVTFLRENELDVCGENGEYHTFVVDGPLFKKPVEFETIGIYENEYCYSLNIQ